jgi:signal transduction histidine kinase
MLGPPRRGNAEPDAGVGRLEATETNPTTIDPSTSLKGGRGDLRADDTVAALRTLRYGGMDDSTRSIALPPVVRATVSPAISALRWGAVGYGLVLGAPDAFDGSYSTVVTVAVCLFITTWRTIIPIRLGSPLWADRAPAFLDVALFSLGIGFGGGLESPFIFCAMTAMVVVAFGWGHRDALAAILIGVVFMAIGVLPGDGSIAEQWNDQRDLTILLTIVVVVLAGASVSSRLIDSERRRSALAGQVESLSEANGLLTLVNSVARTLPTSLTLREALSTLRRQIDDTFDVRVVCLLAFDDNAEEWLPKLADGCELRPAYRTGDLPEPLAVALASSEPILRADLTGMDSRERISPSSGSGLYVRLRTRKSTVGLLGLEHPDPQHFDERDTQLLTGVAEVLALTIDNARWFGRLRSLGAEEERVRLARDLHDRLGQWLTYIGFELERIQAVDPTRSDDLDRLHRDVQAALDELRETLRQLRSGVTEDAPLARIGDDLVKGFAQRTGIDATFRATEPDDSLPVPVENELFRILQESLNNVAKHAAAERVDVVWTIEGGNFELTVTDDGKGFETARGVRDSAYGLVGMRERADVIGAQLSVESRPGAGTTIRVHAGKPLNGSTPSASVPMGHA